MASNAYVVEYAKTGRASCKNTKCKNKKIEKDTIRVGRISPNPFDEGEMKTDWFHLGCIFDQLSRARAATKKINSSDDLDGFENLKKKDQARVQAFIEGKGEEEEEEEDSEEEPKKAAKKKTTATKKKSSTAAKKKRKAPTSDEEESEDEEVEAPKKRKAPPAKKAKAQVPSEEDESEDTPKAKPRRVARRRAAARANS